MEKIQLESVDPIIQATSEYLGIPVAILKQPKIKVAKVAYARHVAQYLACRLTYKSKTHIAKCFNQSDHTSVIYGVGCIAKRLKKKDVAVRSDINAIEMKLVG